MILFDEVIIRVKVSEVLGQIRTDFLQTVDSRTGSFFICQQKQDTIRYTCFSALCIK